MKVKKKYGQPTVTNICACAYVFVCERETGHRNLWNIIRKENILQSTKDVSKNKTYDLLKEIRIKKEYIKLRLIAEFVVIVYQTLVGYLKPK